MPPPLGNLPHPLERRCQTNLKVVRFRVSEADASLPHSVRSSNDPGSRQEHYGSLRTVNCALTRAGKAGRLALTVPFNAMFTHRVKLASIDEIDAELLGWLQEAYQEAV